MGIKNSNPISSFCSPTLVSPRCRDPRPAPAPASENPLLRRAPGHGGIATNTTLLPLPRGWWGPALPGVVAGGTHQKPPNPWARCPAPAVLRAQRWGQSSAGLGGFYHPRATQFLAKALIPLQIPWVQLCPMSFPKPQGSAFVPAAATGCAPGASWLLPPAADASPG